MHLSEPVLGGSEAQMVQGVRGGRRPLLRVVNSPSSHVWCKNNGTQFYKSVPVAPTNFISLFGHVTLWNKSNHQGPSRTNSLGMVWPFVLRFFSCIWQHGSFPLSYDILLPLSKTILSWFSSSPFWMQFLRLLLPAPLVLVFLKLLSCLSLFRGFLLASASPQSHCSLFPTLSVPKEDDLCGLSKHFPGLWFHCGFGQWEANVQMVGVEGGVYLPSLFSCPATCGSGQVSLQVLLGNSLL